MPQAPRDDIAIRRISIVQNRLDHAGASEAQIGHLDETTRCAFN